MAGLVVVSPIVLYFIWHLPRSEREPESSYSVLR
jgi:hypothetical protein